VVESAFCHWTTLKAHFKALPEKPFAISFDDAYRSIYQAVSYLKRKDFPLLLIY